MKRTWLILSLFAITIIAQPTFAEEIIKVSIFDIHPTQPAVGVASTDYFRKSKYSKITDINEYRASILAETPLKAVRGPGGAIYLTDGHHRARGIFRTSLEKCENLKPAEGVSACIKKAEIRVNIEGDYSKSSWDDFVDALYKGNNIYLPSQLWARIRKGEISKQQIFKNPGGLIPPNIGELANDPMRSALGSLFSRMKFNIDANNFINYLEFFVAEKIADKVKVEAGHEFDPEVQINLTRAIFYNPEVLKYMRCLARTDDTSWDKAQTDINLALKLDANVPFDQASCETGK